ncbi:LOW QUALITY PROTEIN: hypothetical protein PanWU01x14_188120 [Parasponia andersonii]|uniref:Uncharacterized protein n=1 Tax=Parasponia andersonii TaxID=3476 RepID=A0A2P5C375_PARAD|nr:LOW QUALITY PROTEIN: hypothetical protein PanWU01x14_188120 [Parasponia andersonii]
MLKPRLASSPIEELEAREHVFVFPILKDLKHKRLVEAEPHVGEDQVGGSARHVVLVIVWVAPDDLEDLVQQGVVSVLEPFLEGHHYWVRQAVVVVVDSALAYLRG